METPSDHAVLRQKARVRIPEYSVTYFSDIRPPIPGYPATFDTLL